MVINEMFCEERINGNFEMPPVTWILVADRSRAKLFHALPDGQSPYPTLGCWSHAAGRLQPRDRDSDEPGRVVHPAGYVSAVEPHEDRDHVEARRFSKELVSHLESLRQEHRFDQFVVIAPPGFLGVLRDSWTPSLRSMIARELNLDLSGLPDSELQKRLESLDLNGNSKP